MDYLLGLVYTGSAIVSYGTNIAVDVLNILRSFGVPI